MSKTARFLLLAVSVIVIVGAVGFAVMSRGGDDPAGGDLTVVKGLVGSEKAPFFHDPDVQQAFAEQGYRLEIDTSGSRAMIAKAAQQPDAYDFYFPSSAPVADELGTTLPGSRQTGAFQTPLVILTFTDIEQILQANGLATPAQGGNPASFNLATYSAAVHANTKWAGLTNNQAYPPNKAVLVTTTDPVRSNSGLMFASLTSHVANGGATLDDPAQVPAVAGQIAPLFAGQGYKEASTEGPFENYLAVGKGSTPLLLAYESQLLSRQLAKSPEVSDDMVVLYPDPGMFSKHVVVSRTEPGNTVAELLTTDDTLVALEAQHGFRPQTRGSALDTAVEEAGLPPLPQVNNAIEPSTYPILDQLAQALSPQAAAEPDPTPTELAQSPEVQGQ